MVHPAAIDVVGQVIERVEAYRCLIARCAGDRYEIDVVDFLRAIAIDQIEVRSANALDCRDVEFHRADGPMHRGRTTLHRFIERLPRVMHAERHRVGGWAVRITEFGDLSFRFHVQQEIDVALLIAADILRPVR